MDKSKKISRFGIVIYVIALLFRLGPVIAAREMEIGLDDMFQYDMLARSLAGGEGYRWYGEEDLALIERYFPLDFIMDEYDPRGILTSFRPPGYPFFLALIYKIFGLENRFFITRLIQAGVGALLAPLTYLLGKRTFDALSAHSEKIARLAAVLVAVYPMLVIYPLALATEVTFVPLLLGVLVVLLKAGESGKWQHYLLAGVLLGAAALTRSVVVAMLPFLMLWAWLMAKSWKGALILLACVLAFTVPWSVRNSRLHGQFVFIENAMGYTLYMGYHPDTDGRFEYGPSLDLMPYLDDGERNEIGMEKGLEFIQDDPGKVPYLMLRKLGYFYGLERRAMSYFYSNNFLGYIPQPFFTLLFVVFTLPFALYTCLAVFTALTIRWRKAQILVALVYLLYLGPHLLLLAEPRFHLALVPITAVLGRPTPGWNAAQS